MGWRDKGGPDGAIGRGRGIPWRSASGAAEARRWDSEYGRASRCPHRLTFDRDEALRADYRDRSWKRHRGQQYRIVAEPQSDRRVQ